MEELNELYMVLKMIKKDLPKERSPIPIFSFEGLPGAGKTTQIKLVSKALEKKYGGAYYVDLPTDSSVGKIMKALYSDSKKWNIVRKANPWLNLVLLSTDLRLAVKKARSRNAQYIFMSRGILSTYYYNLDAYGDNMNEIWKLIEADMRAFYMPEAIIFMEIPEDVAFERVVKRNRGPLRKMDQIIEMKRDKKVLKKYLKKIDHPNVYYIDALGSKEEVTQRILEKIKLHMVSYE